MDVRTVAEQDAADFLPADVLHHTLVAGVELDDLAVHGVVDAFDGGNAVAHVPDDAHLLVFGFQVEVLNLCFEEGDDILQAAHGVDCFQRLPELLHTALGRPVVFVRPGPELEAADKALILQESQFYLLAGVLFLQKGADALQLPGTGRCDIRQNRLECSFGPLSHLLPPPSSKTHRRGRCRVRRLHRQPWP